MLNIETLNRLNDIFIAKGWDVNDDPYKLFNRFISNLSKLEPEEQNFILEITKSYNVYNSSDYEKMLSQCLNQLNLIDYFDGTNIIVAPLLPYIQKNELINSVLFEYNVGEKKVKSSNFVSYLFKSNQLSYLNYLIDQNIEVVNFLNSEDVSLVLNANYKILFVDDYIGSGGTMLTTIKSYLQLGIDKDKIMVLGLLIDQKGENRLNDLEIKFVRSEYEYNTLHSLFGEVNDEIRMKINKIAKKLKVTKSYKSGYMDTMALVSLIRTPNNTLPFYWSNKYQNDILAPFPRFKE